MGNNRMRSEAVEKPIMRSWFIASALALPGVVGAQQTTCERIYNTIQCNTQGATISAPDVNGPWQNFARQQAAQSAATAQMIAAQATARAQIEAARIQADAQVESAQIESHSTAPVASNPPPVSQQQPLEEMTPDARRSAIGQMAARATTENLQKSLPRLQHLCETTQTPMWC